MWTQSSAFLPKTRLYLCQGGEMIELLEVDVEELFLYDLVSIYP